MITRRNFVAGLATLLAAPAIVRVSSLMQLRSTPLVVPKWRHYYQGHPVSDMQDVMAMIEQTKETIRKSYFVDLVSILTNDDRLLPANLTFYGDAPTPPTFRGIEFHRDALFA